MKNSFLLVMPALAATIAAGGAAARNRVTHDPPKLMTPDASYQCGPRSGVSVKTDVKVLARCAPAVPEECVAAMKFRTTIRLLVDADDAGRVRNIRIVETSNPCLDQAAANAASKWTFDTAGAARADIPVAIRLIRHSGQYQRDRALEGFRSY